MAKKYELTTDWDGGIIKIKHLDPQSIGSELARIEAAEKGLTPRVVVARARPKTAVLHDCFEWNNSVAGEEYRFLQAAQLIRCVRVIETDSKGEEVPLRAFIHVRNGDGKSRYLKTAKVMNDEHLRSLAINEARQYVARAKAKLQEFEELLSIYRALERVEKKLERAA